MGQSVAAPFHFSDVEPRLVTFDGSTVLQYRAMRHKLATPSYAASTTVDVNAIDASGIGKKIGILRLSDSKHGLRITPQLADLPPGEHGFHVHVNPDCRAGKPPGPTPLRSLSQRINGRTDTALGN